MTERMPKTVTFNATPQADLHILLVSKN